MKQEAQNAINDIARSVLLLETLETRNSGEDFEEQAVWSIKKALEEAYQQGLKDGQKQ